MSSALAWMIIDVPPLLNSESLPSAKLASLSTSLVLALPRALTVKLTMSPA